MDREKTNNTECGKHPPYKEIGPATPPATGGPVTDNAHHRVGDTVVDLGRKHQTAHERWGETHCTDQVDHQHRSLGIEQTRHRQRAEAPAKIEPRGAMRTAHDPD